MSKNAFVEQKNRNISKIRYYNNIFPVEKVFMFLNSTGLDITKRDVSYSLYNRFISLEKATDLRLMLLDTPTRLDIGGFYLYNNSMQKRTGFAKELIFDVDYCNFCNSCDKEKKIICSSCWDRFFPSTMSALSDILVNILKIKQNRIIFFFSGGKGFHCWVLDDRFFFISAQERRAILHVVQDLLLKKLIELRIIHFFFPSFSYSLPDEVDSPKNSRSTEDASYKRLQLFDEAVTCEVVHTIRMPFSVHDRSGLVCVPINLSMSKFDDICVHPDDDRKLAQCVELFDVFLFLLYDEL